MIMEATVEKPEFAWEPLTLRGVAAFAGASLGRLALVQFVFALLAAASVVWFLHSAWFPTISEAVRQMPPEGEIRAGRLDWQGEPAQSLAEGRFLGLAVDLQHEGSVRSPAQVQVEFGWDDVRVISLFGFVRWAYPKGWVAGFNRGELEPMWGAWAPAILAVAAVLVTSGLMMSWAILATVYCLPAWLVGFYADREVSVRGSWRLAGAALMPGALLLTAAIFFYGLGVLDPVHLVVAGAAHLLMGWIYVIVSPLYLPRHTAAGGQTNPFVAVRNEAGMKRDA